MRTGLLTRDFVLSRTSSESVAEKSRVCRDAGVFDTMRRMSGRKPMSSMRSASSRTRVSTCERLQSPELMRSMRRPGVATTRSHPLWSAARCGSYETPPTRTVAVWPVRAQMAVATSSIWAASSRVGVTTSMRGPCPWRAWPSRSSVGSRKAAVLPVPVCAAAMTSVPARTAGIDAAWTGVGAS